MSVINDMLRDLNQRQAPEVSEARVGIPQSLIEPQKQTFNILFLALVLILLIAGITVYWFASGTSPSSEALLNTQSAAPVSRPAVESSAELVPASSSETSVLAEQSVLIEQNIKSKEAALADEEPKTEVPTVSDKVLVQEPTPAPEILVVTEVLSEADRPKPETAAAKVSEPNLVTEKKSPASSANATPHIEQGKTDSSVSESDIVSSPVQSTMQVSLSPQARDQEMAEHAVNLFARNNAAQAYRELVAFIAAHEVDSRSRSVLANFLLQENRLAEAGDVLLNAPIQSSPELRQLKARWYAAQGEDKMALYTLNSILPEINQYPDYYVLLAAYYQRFGWHKEAIQTYLKLVEYDDSIADWWAGLGLAADRNQDLKQAALAYQQAIELPGLAPELANFITSRLKQLRTPQRSS